MDMEISLSSSDLSAAITRLQTNQNDTGASKILWPSACFSDLNTTDPTDAFALKVKGDDSMSLTMSVSSDANDENMVTIQCRGSIESSDFRSTSSYYESVIRNLSIAFAAVLLDLELTSEEKLTSLRLASYN